MNGVLVRPIITEKSLSEAGRGWFTFEVVPKARKSEVKAEVEKLFGVKVQKVRTISMTGKKYRTGKKWSFGVRPDWKKAVVLVGKNQKIGLFEVPIKEGGRT